jgi:ATP-dependent DNA helicase DinG
LADLSLAAFEAVVCATPGFRPRLGQHAMAACVADTLARADLGEHPTPAKAIAVIQAGTGVGKSAAYASTAVALALERKTRVLISTATVALQEQLMAKDLPALALTMDKPFVFALAKGRGRYVCKLKLERLAGTGGAPRTCLMPMKTRPSRQVWLGAVAGRGRRAPHPSVREHGHPARHQPMGWRPRHPGRGTDPRDWSTVAAERHTCTVRHCPRFATAATTKPAPAWPRPMSSLPTTTWCWPSLGMKTLPDLDNCLVIFDEGHHLPAVALDQFSSSHGHEQPALAGQTAQDRERGQQCKLHLHAGEDVQRSPASSRAR